MEAHPDEYSEISDIKNRYETLFNSNDKLRQEQQNIELEYEREKAETNEYQKRINAEIMALTNDTQSQQEEFNKIEDKKSQIKSEEEDNQKKKLDKTSELGMILMAINNLYNKCNEREGKTTLKYPVQGVAEPEDFNRWKTRADYAEQQMKMIIQLVKDFQVIIKNWEEEERKLAHK